MNDIDDPTRINLNPKPTPNRTRHKRRARPGKLQVSGKGRKLTGGRRVVMMYGNETDAPLAARSGGTKQ